MVSKKSSVHTFIDYDLALKFYKAVMEFDVPFKLESGNGVYTFYVN